MRRRFTLATLHALEGGSGVDAGAQVLLEGGAGQMRDTVERWHRAGATHLCAAFGRDPERAPELISLFGREVLPDLAGSLAR